MIEFAILAPVPVDHLESGYQVIQKNSYVSFGSQKWELFRQVDEMRNGARVPVLIYPSHENVEALLTYQVTWIGWYIGHVVEMKEKRKDEIEGHRPPTTAHNPDDNAYSWAVFWRVMELQPLPPDKQIPISKISAYKTGYWRKNTPPFGPEVIAYPEWFDKIIYPLIPLPAIDVAEPPKRIETTINRIIRDTAKAQLLKQLYNFRCQVCGEQLKLGSNKYYVEVHHIRPLGGDHNGIDDFSNMLVVCPNHHALFDYGIPKFISVDKVEIDGEQYELFSSHKISDENIRYHNQIHQSNA